MFFIKKIKAWKLRRAILKAEVAKKAKAQKAANIAKSEKEQRVANKKALVADQFSNTITTLPEPKTDRKKGLWIHGSDWDDHGLKALNREPGNLTVAKPCKADEEFKQNAIKTVMTAQ